MIQLLRVDHRLLHGQVAFSWTSAVSADCILVANDDVVVNDLRKTTIKLAQPSGVKLVMKSMKDAVEAINSGVTDKYKLLVVVESIKDSKMLVDQCPSVKSVNLGGTKATKETRQISKAMNVSADEENMIKEMVDKGIEVEIRMVPTDKKVKAESVL